MLVGVPCIPYRPIVTGSGAPLGGFVHANRKGQPIFVDERFQRHRRHRGMMFKHRVQPDDLEVGMFEEVEGALRLRRSMRDASRAQHLKRMQQNRPAA
jgi:hypothetical protein